MSHRLSPKELAAAMREKAAAGKNVVLGRERALWVALLLDYEPGEPLVGAASTWRIDLYASGSCVYKLDQRGEIFEIAAWARNSLVARAALDALRQEYRGEKFSQRRKGWVESDD